MAQCRHWPGHLTMSESDSESDRRVMVTVTVAYSHLAQAGFRRWRTSGRPEPASEPGSRPGPAAAEVAGAVPDGRGSAPLQLV